MKVGFVNSISAAPTSIVGSTMVRSTRSSGSGIDGKITIEIISEDDTPLDVAKASAVTQLIQQEKVDSSSSRGSTSSPRSRAASRRRRACPRVLSYSPQKGKETEAFHGPSATSRAPDNADALVKVFADKGWKNVVGAADVLTIQQERFDYLGEMAPAAACRVHQAQR